MTFRKTPCTPGEMLQLLYLQGTRLQTSRKQAWQSAGSCRYVRNCRIDRAHELLLHWWQRGAEQQATTFDPSRMGPPAQMTLTMECLECGVGVPNTADAWVCETCKEKT